MNLVMHDLAGRACYGVLLLAFPESDTQDLIGFRMIVMALDAERVLTVLQNHVLCYYYWPLLARHVRLHRVYKTVFFLAITSHYRTSAQVFRPL